MRGDRAAVYAGMAGQAAYAARDKEVSWACADCLARVGELNEALMDKARGKQHAFDV